MGYKDYGFFVRECDDLVREIVLLREGGLTFAKIARNLRSRMNVYIEEDAVRYLWKRHIEQSGISTNPREKKEKGGEVSMRVRRARARGKAFYVYRLRQAGMTLKEIGQKIGLSKQRVGQYAIKAEREIACGRGHTLLARGRNVYSEYVAELNMAFQDDAESGEQDQEMA